MCLLKSCAKAAEVLSHARVSDKRNVEKKQTSGEDIVTVVVLWRKNKGLF